MILLVKATALLIIGGAVAFALRGGSPAVRHLVWTLTVAALLVLPLATLGLPDLRIPVPLSSAPGEAAAEAGVLMSPMAEETALASEPVGAGPVSGATLWHSVASPTGLFFLWTTGLAVVLIWLVGGRIALRFVRRRAVRLENDEWDPVLRDAAWLLEVERPVRLYRSRSATMPVTWGVLRPVVLLPADADSWPEDRRRAVLLHELAHVARGDYLTQLLAGLACALYWFHPGVWYAARRMRVERERACDERVVAAGTRPADYAAHLLDLARHCTARVAAPLVALHMARPSQLEGRLLAVLTASPGRRPPTRLGIAAATVAAVVLTLPLSAIQPAVVDFALDPAAVADEAPEPASAAPAPTAGLATGLPAAPPALVDTPPPAPPDSPPPASPGVASDASVQVSASADSVIQIVPRVAPSRASFAIVTRSGQVALLLRESTIVVQLTDRGLEEIGRSEARGDEKRGFLSTIFESMLRTGLRVLLDHGLEYSLTDLREARYEDGRLVLENHRGKDVFGTIDMDGRDIMTDFHPRDARAFAARANAARPRR